VNDLEVAISVQISSSCVLATATCRAAFYPLHTVPVIHGSYIELVAHHHGILSGMINHRIDIIPYHRA